MSTSGASGDSPKSPQARRFKKPILRQASLIIPRTGERVRKSFTLRSPPHSEDDDHNESRPLLRRRAPPLYRETTVETAGRILTNVKTAVQAAATSSLAQDIFKCSIAYLLGSLATLVLPIANTLGHQDGKHMVATVTVYFHPARTAGSMFEAFTFAIIAVTYAAVISLLSMATSVFFARQDLLEVGHAIVLVVFCGAGLGFVGWLKQRMGTPLVNVACSLTSLAITTVLTKEGSVQAAQFSYEKVAQVLLMVLMGMGATVAVSLTIKPRGARFNMREDVVKITDLLEDRLTSITRAFLSGSDEELDTVKYGEVADKYRALFNKLSKDMREARYEHFVLGTEREFHIQSKLVKCIDRLGQSLVGLRSAASIQSDLITESLSREESLPHVSTSMFSSMFGLGLTSELHDNLSAINEEPEEAETHDESQNGQLHPPINDEEVATEPADIFALFISELGPPMKSLAFTLKEVLSELPFGPGPEYLVPANTNFRKSLLAARDLFVQSRRQSLQLLYRNNVLARARSSEVKADYEEVAASCGYFSSCLQDFAEDTVIYLEILEQLKSELDCSPRKRSWKWLQFWRRSSSLDDSAQAPDPIGNGDPEQGMSVAIPDPGPPPTISKVRPKKRPDERAVWVRLWRAIIFIQRDDIKFAVKVGIGAILYAMISFIPSTRPFYQHWRGEWGLLSYMLVCSMTIGASNTTGLQRFIGTCIGAMLAVSTWILSDANPIVLGLLGWLTSVGCFYIVLGLGKGPMGRFILLTYNLSALYAYSLSVNDLDDDDDEGGVKPEIWSIVRHRVVAVSVGCFWGLIITRVIWPISARKKLKDGMSLLWLRMALVWKKDPSSLLMDSDARSSHLDIRESGQLQQFLAHLLALRESAMHEFEPQGPFPNKTVKSMLDATGRMLGAFIAMNTLITKDLKASAGEAEILHYTKDERVQLAVRISHLFSVLASSIKLEYPLNDALPNIEHARDRLFMKIYQFRQTQSESVATDEDYELLYAYALVTGQIAKEIEIINHNIEEVYGVLDEDSLKLR